jgi:hypothetical protein
MYFYIGEIHEMMDHLYTKFTTAIFFSSSFAMAWHGCSEYPPLLHFTSAQCLLLLAPKMWTLSVCNKGSQFSYEICYMNSVNFTSTATWLISHVLVMKVSGDSGLYEFLTHRVMSASSAGLIDWVCNTCPEKLASSDTSSNVKWDMTFNCPKLCT